MTRTIWSDARTMFIARELLDAGLEVAQVPDFAEVLPPGAARHATSYAPEDVEAIQAVMGAIEGGAIARYGDSSHHVGVDSGSLWIGDPCYLIDRLSQDTWSAMVDRQFTATPGGFSVAEPFGEHQGLWVGSFGGDGVYEVEVERDHRGRVARVIVTLAGGQEDATDDDL